MPSFTFDAEFSRSGVADDQFSKKHFFNGFHWHMSCSSEVTSSKEQLCVHLFCNPVESVQTYSCTVEWIIRIPVVSVASRCKKSTFSDQGNAGLGIPVVTLETLDEEINGDKFTVSIELFIEEKHLEPILQQPQSLDVSFVTMHKLVPLSVLTSGKELRCVFYECSTPWWVCFRRSSDDRLLYAVHLLDGNGDVKTPVKKPVTFTVRCGNMVESSNSDFGKTNNIRVPGMFYVDEISFSVTVALPKSTLVTSVKPERINFGRENIAISQFGNFTLHLEDGSTMKLSSLILSYNSPKLRRLILEKKCVECELVRFNPAAVRIFVDACYTGTLKKLTNDTKSNIFHDLISIFAALKVEWPVEECIQFLAKGSKRLTNIPSLMESFCVTLAISINYGYNCYLEHLLGEVDEATGTWVNFLRPALKIAKSKSEIDLVMVIAVKKNWITSLAYLLPSLVSDDTLLYILENFNFELVGSDSLKTLCRGLSVFPADGRKGRFIQNFITALRQELVPMPSPQERSASKNDSEGAHVDKADADDLTQDSTLASLARSKWLQNRESTWPCKSKRPFSMKPRKLEDPSEIPESASSQHSGGVVKEDKNGETQPSSSGMAVNPLDQIYKLKADQAAKENIEPCGTENKERRDSGSKIPPKRRRIHPRKCAARKY